MFPAGMLPALCFIIIHHHRRKYCQCSSAPSAPGETIIHQLFTNYFWWIYVCFLSLKSACKHMSQHESTVFISVMYQSCLELIWLYITIYCICHTYPESDCCLTHPEKNAVSFSIVVLKMDPCCLQHCTHGVGF